MSRLALIAAVILLILVPGLAITLNRIVRSVWRQAAETQQQIEKVDPQPRAIQP